MKNRILGALDKRIKTQPRRDSLDATLGDGQGNLKVTGRPGFVYARVKQPSGTETLMQVRCRKVTQQYDLPVKVRPNAFDGVWEVVEDDPVTAPEFWGDTNMSGNVGLHAASHGMFGGDPILLDARQLMTFRVYPTSPASTSVQVAPYLYRYGGTWKYYAGTSAYDLAAYIPDGTFTIQCVACLGLDASANTLTVVAGADTYIPTASAAAIPFAGSDVATALAGASEDFIMGTAVRLYGGQTAVNMYDAFYNGFQLAGTAEHRLHNWTAVSSPTAADDTGDGYSVGSLWLVESAGKLYLCSDATASAAVWIDITGGGGSGSLVSWNPDAVPQTSHASDDEFNDASITGWTEYDTGGIQTPGEAAGVLTLAQTTQATATLTGEYKALPGDSAYTIALKFKLSSVTVGSGDKAFGGLALFEDGADDTKKVLLLGYGVYDVGGTSYPGYGSLYFTANNVWSSATTAGSVAADTWYYVRLRRNGASYLVDYGTDGETWNTIDYSATVALFTPSHIGLAIVNHGTGSTLTNTYEFFRYRASFDSATDPVYGNLTLDQAVQNAGSGIQFRQADGENSYIIPLRFNTADTGAADFTFVLDGTPVFDGTRDNALFFGYNVGTQGTRLDTSEPTLHLCIESNYDIGADNWMEYYVQYTNAAGTTTFRPFAFIISRTLDTSVSEFRGTSISFLAEDSTLYGRWSASGITFGSASDTNLYRSAASTLKTDDSFIALGNITGNQIIASAGGVLIQESANLQFQATGDASPRYQMGISGAGFFQFQSVDVGTPREFLIVSSGGLTKAQIAFETGISTFQGGMTINDAGGDSDTRIEGDTNANLIFADASTDRVGFGKNNPAYLVDVAGKFSADDTGRIAKALSATTFSAATLLRINGYNGNDKLAGISFNYAASPDAQIPPVFIGVKGALYTSYTVGSIIFATRATDTNTEPVERMFIKYTGEVGIGTTDPLAQTHFVAQTTTTDAVKEVTRLDARVSTAATGSAAGFGPALTFYGESATDGSYRQMAQFDAAYVVPTDASRTTEAHLCAYDSGGAREAIRFGANGSAATLGLYGVTAVARPAAYTQTYSTATRTHANPTAATVTDTDGAYGFAAAADRTALVTAINAVIADQANVKQVINQIIDDLQALGALQ